MACAESKHQGDYLRYPGMGSSHPLAEQSSSSYLRLEQFLWLLINLFATTPARLEELGWLGSSGLKTGGQKHTGQEV